jgi:hypothetical protein
VKLVYRIVEEDFVSAHDLSVAHENSVRRLFRRINPWLGGIMLIFGVATLVWGHKTPIRSIISFLVGGDLLYHSFDLRKYFRDCFRKNKLYAQDFRADVLCWFSLKWRGDVFR